MLCITNSKMNNHNIHGAQYDTKLYPLQDIFRIFPNKNPNFSMAILKIVSFPFQVLHNGIFNFHNFTKLSKTRTEPAQRNKGVKGLNVNLTVSLK